MNRLLLSAGVGIAFLAAAAFRWLTLAEFPNDHFDHVALAQQLRLGALPVRDFTDEGLPLTYAVSALAWTILKTPFLAEGVVVTLGFALAAALSFRTAAIASHSLIAAGIAAAAQIALYPRTYSYPKLLVQAVAVAVAWWAAERYARKSVPSASHGSEWRVMAALAAATALGYYFRHDHALYLGLATVVLLVVASSRAGLPAITRSLFLYGALTVAFVLPHLIYVQWAAGIPTYFAISREYVKAEAGGGAYHLPVPYLDVKAGLSLRPEAPTVNVRWAPSVDDRSRSALEQRYRMDSVAHDEGATWRYRIRDTSPGNLQAIRSDPNVEDTHGFDRLEKTDAGGWLSRIQPGPGWRVRENSLAVLFWTCWLLPFAAITMLVVRRGQIPTSEAAAAAMLTTLALCSNVGFLRSPLEIRLPDVAVPQTILGAWIGATVWRWPRAGLTRVLFRGAVAVVTVNVLIAIVLLSQAGQLLRASGLLRGVDGVVTRSREVTTHLRDDRPGPVPSNPSAVLLPFFDYLRQCTDPQDRLLYAWYSPEVYLVADRGFAGDHRKLFAPFHASSWEQARTIARLKQQHVPVIVIPRQRRQSFEAGYPDLWQYLQSRYVPMATIPPDDPDGFEILRDSSWTSDRHYRNTTWPCPVA